MGQRVTIEDDNGNVLPLDELLGSANHTQPITAGTTSNTTISAKFLARIAVTSTGTHDLVVTDGSGGTPLVTIPSGASMGVPVEVRMPVAKSIFVTGNSGNPAVTIAYS